MLGIFRLTRAEFRKIFRRPSVFLVAILLVATVFVSIQFFDPQPRTNYDITYDGITLSTDYYNRFTKDDDYNSKIDIDNSYDAVLTSSNYYVNYFDRSKYLQQYYNDIFTKFDALKNESNNNLKEEKYTEFKTALTTFMDKYLDFTGLDIHEHISSLQNNKQYTENGCQSLKTLISATETHTPNSIINYFETNEYADKNTGKLADVYNTAKNPIYTTIYLMSKEITKGYSNYYQLITEGGITKQKLINDTRIELYNKTGDFLNYLKDISNSEFPIILIDKIILENTTTTLESAISELGNVTGDINLDTHKTIRENLSYIKFPEIINTENFLKHIYEVNINEDLAQILLITNETVNKNREAILSKIEEHKNDDSIKNISLQVTKYKLLAETYNKYVIDNVKFTVVDRFNSSQYNSFYNYDFDKFNKYEYNERINLNKYYIDNNVYENEYLTMINSDVSSDIKTNMFDFMYFSLELCSLIIIIFTMMLICNLITSETESGTIKLLLIRPYKRSKILTSKILATILLIVTFMVFSTILTGVGGFVLYGYSAKTVIAVFNSTTVFTASPILIIALKLVTIFIDILFYLFLALMLSMIVKNYAGAISTTIVLFIMNLALVFIFKNAIWFIALPGINMNLFKYFGNSFIATSQGLDQGLISQILSPTLMGSMSIWISIAINAVYTIFFLTLSYILFNKRDY